MDGLIKKNILDLEFQRNLMIASTTIILFFTYLIGISIGFVTKQIAFDLTSVLIILILTLGIGAPLIFFYLKAVENIRKIPFLLKNIKQK